MRISLNWLRDYLDIKPDVEINQLSESLTLAGLEVEAIDYVREKAQHLSLGIISRIKEGKDKKIIYEVTTSDETLSVSGPVPARPVGMVVAFKRAIHKKSTVFYELATFSDVGFPQGGHEIIAFERDFFENGWPDKLSLVKEFDDVIFTLGVTPNRADALSHLGVSRELSALLDLGARSPMLTPKEMAGFTHEKVSVEINNAEDCPRYACRVVENVKIKESPFWLKLRLLSVGGRPINNVVDITNYVMLSRGQPMHAFDYEKLHMENGRAKIVVRRAAPGEKLTTLDGQDVELDVTDVVIADLMKPLALAGVIGGLACAVNAGETSTVLLESAYFDPKNVRMTARRHGITTESSYRFERGSDPNGVVDALNFAARLLTEIADAKVCREVIDAYRKRIDPIELKMRPERAQAILGIEAKDFDQDQLRRRFLRLGIETVAKRGDAIYFRVPTHRSDISREIDLIEEAARMIGYDKVKETSIGLGGVGSDSFSNKPALFLGKKVRETLVARGFCESINYAFLSKDLQNWFLSAEEQDRLIEIKNPWSDRYGVMRMSLIPGLFKNLLHNQRNQEKSIELFEIGTVFLGKREIGEKPQPAILHGPLDQDSFSHEKQMIAGIMAGRTPFKAFDQPLGVVDFYTQKGVLTEIFLVLGLSDQFPHASIFFEHGSELPYLHPGESSTIVYRNGASASRVLGQFGKLHPHIASALEVVGDVFLFELNCEEIVDVIPEIAKFKAFSRYPTIERDVAFLVDEEVKVGAILQAIENVPDGSRTIVNMQVFDIYRGKNIEVGKKSVAIALTMQKDDRTLTDEDADAFVSDFVSKVEQKTGAQLR